MTPPIFIIGSGRSGTTLLYNLLTDHDELAWVSNLSNRVPALPFLVRASRYNKLRSLHRAFDPAMETIEGYAHCGLGSSTLPWADECDIDIEMLRLRVTKYFEAHCRAWGRERLVTKNTSNSMRIALLELLFPGAQYVVIHRHPYSVISSLLKVDFWPNLNLWWSGKSPHQLELEGTDPLAIAAEHWMRQVSAIHESVNQLPASRVHIIAYENLVQFPEQICENIFEFLGLKQNDAFRQNIKRRSVSTASINKWKQSADKGRYSNVNAIVEPMATALSYELV